MCRVSNDKLLVPGVFLGCCTDKGEDKTLQREVRVRETGLCGCPDCSNLFPCPVQSGQMPRGQVCNHMTRAMRFLWAFLSWTFYLFH